MDVSVGSATANNRFQKCSTNSRRHFLKFLLPEIAEKVRWLSVPDVRLHHADVIRDVAVDGKNIGQAVEVIIEKERAEREGLVRHPCNTGVRSLVGKEPPAFVVEERHALVCEIA